MKQFYWLLLFALCPCSTYAQDVEKEKENEFSITFQNRSRAEYRNGALSPRTPLHGV